MVWKMLTEIEKNKLFENKTRIFFLGIGGVSMSSIALAFRRKGHFVSGYDSTPSDTTRMLEENGVHVSYSFCREDYKGIDVVIYTNAIQPTDPVFFYPQSLGITMISRAKALGYLMKSYRHAIGVAGTHGKSTTTGMLSYIFISQDRDPTVFAGAHLPILGGNYCVGQGNDFIFEACEYQDSFLHFFPTVAVVLNVGFDHADYFTDLNDVVSSFQQYLFLVQGDGTAIVNLDDAGAMASAHGYTGKLVTFSQKDPSATVYAKHVHAHKGFYCFDVMYRGKCFASVELGVPGAFNVSNALAAIAAAIELGVSPEAVVNGLKAFHGVRRRFEVRGKLGDAVVIDDYAHHPDEIRATLQVAAAMELEPVTVVFQSHTYTRTRALMDEITLAFEQGCEQVIYTDIYAAREAPIPGVDGRTLAKRTQNGIYLGEDSKVVEYVRRTKKLHQGAIIVMGAGDVVNLTPQILEDPHAH